uniref:Reverse transcriptase domain-containing protein n=1 Tax=Astyanax mexicanus TaxID=7994 RepID=A0A3B1K1K8_ASTMX
MWRNNTFLLFTTEFTTEYVKMAAPLQAAAAHAHGEVRKDTGENAIPFCEGMFYDRQILLSLNIPRDMDLVDVNTKDLLKSLGLLHSEGEDHSVPTLYRKFGRFPGRRRRRCMRRQKRGARAGVSARAKANSCRTPLPSILLANVRSLENKLDYIRLDIASKREVRDCCAFVFSETWLNTTITDSAISLAGLTTYRADRSSILSGKSRGGGLCIYINNRWCTDSKMASSHCTPDIEFLSVKCRPFYLPRELSVIFIIAVYIPPDADTNVALDILCHYISGLQNKHPGGALIVAGDFNRASMKKVLPHFYQYVHFATRGDNTLDHAYSNIKTAFKATSRPHLGSSDHISVMLTPAYRPVLTKGRPTSKLARVWPEGAMTTLQGCFDCTDWSVFKEAASYGKVIDIGEYAETVSAYIQKCIEDVQTTKHIISRANEKPWMTSELRKLLKARDSAFRSGDLVALRTARARLNKAIRLAKRDHGHKIQKHFQDHRDTRKLWQGIGTITDYKTTPRPRDINIELLNQLNNHFARFEALNNTPAKKTTPHPGEQVLRLDPADVQNTLKRINIRKSPGPDQIPGSVLKRCAEQLTYVLTDIFNISLCQAVVPSCYKVSAIIPVPKKSTVDTLDDYRPVALTSIIMKCFERLVKDHITSILSPLLDPLQFAYRPNRSTEDAISTVLHLTLEHLEHKNALVRILFVDFSSAFNTIIPQNLINKLGSLGLNTPLKNWILDFLTDRPQFVQGGSNRSDTVTLSTGSPQGCVLSPLLYTLMTHDCSAKHSKNYIIKYADDTTLVGLIQDGKEQHYREEVDLFADWCSKNNLILNVKKTKELVIDFRKKAAMLTPVYIRDTAVEIVPDMKFLGVHMANNLTWSLHISSVVKKAHQRLHFLRRLKRSNLSPSVLTTFYRGAIESVLTSSISLWYESSSTSDKKALRRVVRIAERIVGATLRPLGDLAKQRCLMRATNIIKDQTHPSHGLFSLLPSGRRYRSLTCRTTRFRDSFYPMAIRLLNTTKL